MKNLQHINKLVRLLLLNCQYEKLADKDNTTNSNIADEMMIDLRFFLVEMCYC